MGLALLVAALLSTTAVPAQAVPDKQSSTWVIGFGSIGPVNTGMTVKQAISELGSDASSKADEQYCGLFGLTGNSPTGLTGYAPERGGKLAMLSVGSLFGTSRRGLPKTVQTSKGIKVGTSLATLKAAYPNKLRTKHLYLNTVEILPGPKARAIAFEISDDEVINIATGKARLLTTSEYCG